MALINKFVAWPFDLIRRASMYKDSPGLFGIFTDAGVIVGTAVPLLTSYLFYRNMRWPSGLIAAYIGGGVGNAILPGWVDNVTANGTDNSGTTSGADRNGNKPPPPPPKAKKGLPDYKVQGRLGSSVRVPNFTSPLGSSSLRPDEVYDRYVPVPRYPFGNSYNYAMAAGTEGNTWTRSKLHPQERY